VLASNFTGYLLPWDQLAYWAITVSTSLFAYIPKIGAEISRFLLAGPEVGQGALSNFYAMHVVTLPLLLVGIMAYHFWKVRKNGGISQPDLADNERVERVTTIPHLVRVEFAAAALVILGVTIFSMFNPAPLGGIANPLNSPNPAKAAWYFMGLQELLLHMHPLAAITLVSVILALIFLTPLIDRKSSDIGIYFRSKHGRWAAVVGLLLGINLTPLVVLADEYWIDLTDLFAFKSTAIANGVIPVALALAVLALIYVFLRLYLSWEGRRADHSEAMLGVFVFVATSLVVLTIIGMFFRGENMALVLPF
jgi:quinol-cytochrome oxidoreductase complex cytochrome b subunit